jgi:RNA polymerase sigma-70 factor, ECF subfamily
VQNPERDLLKAVQQGDENALEMIFKEYYQPLCRYAQSFLGDRDEAEEVVQALFTTIWEKRSSMEVSSSLRCYLYQTVRNRCLNVIKHEKIKQLHVAHESSVMPSSHEGVSDSLHAKELEQRIFAAIQQLPEQCRLVFNLSRFEELRYQEIATQLNISVKTVENQMGKALKVMRQQLSDYLFVLIILLNYLLP